jgi:hypothetical protein
MHDATAEPALPIGLLPSTRVSSTTWLLGFPDGTVSFDLDITVMPMTGGRCTDAGPDVVE